MQARGLRYIRQHDIENHSGTPAIGWHPLDVEKIYKERLKLPYPTYPSCLLFNARIPSGGRYETVPQTLKVVSQEFGRARPKSAIRIRGYGPGQYKRMFSG